MKNPWSKLVYLIIIIIIALASYSYLFKIYETRIETSTNSLFADNNSSVTITAVPVNAFGMRVPFRKVITNFQIREGNNLVTIVIQDNFAGKLVLRAKDKVGKVVIYAKPELSLLPTLIEINIYPNQA